MIEERLMWAEGEVSTEEAVDFSTYKLLKSRFFCAMIKSGLTFEEMDSALYPLYLRERDPLRESIDSMKAMGLRIVEGIIKTVEQEAEKREAKA